jgi:HD-GYP domain-containing protein (c-di-GMP phosphodiesterase class II)
MATRNPGSPESFHDTLTSAAQDYDTLYSAWERDRRELSELRASYARLERRAHHVGEAIKRIHAALFDGGVSEMILRSAIVLTGATRGVYVTARGDKLKVRAVSGVDPFARGEPSEFIAAIARKAIDQHDTIVLNDIDHDGASRRPHEEFVNCAAIPVTMMDNLDGVVILADKIPDGFNEEDVEAVLSVGDHARVAMRNVSLERELQNAYLATVSMLADAVEAKDPYTRGHCETASRYARLTGRALELADRERESLCYAALLHDVGKIGVSDGILNKPGPLLPEERQVVESHVRIGYDLIRSVPVLSDVATIVLHHHERYDGAGYPKRLQGDDIPMGSRVLAVVDAYCAMLDKRSYKDALTPAEARAELLRCAGTQFDPDVVNAFIRVLDDPDSLDGDMDDFAECGPLPSLMRLIR